MSDSPVTSTTSKQIDFATIAGLGVAVAGILGGLLLEGGRMSDVSQLTAAMIVMGGTVGAVMVTTPMATFFAALKKLPTVVISTTVSADALLQEILRFAAKARRSGIVSLENEAEGVTDPFFKKALLLAVDGTDLKVVRHTMEQEMTAIEHRGEAEAKVYEAAGGYAPTVGIIGAVMGLIQVMKHLQDIEMVGHGIAVAFVATIYGVAVANILFLPIAAKLKTRMQDGIRLNEMALEGVMSIAEGLNPKLIESQLECFRHGSKSDKKAGPRAAEKAAA